MRSSLSIRLSTKQHVVGWLGGNDTPVTHGLLGDHMSGSESCCFAAAVLPTCWARHVCTRVGENIAQLCPRKACLQLRQLTLTKPALPYRPSAGVLLASTCSVAH